MPYQSTAARREKRRAAKRAAEAEQQGDEVHQQTNMAMEVDDETGPVGGQPTPAGNTSTMIAPGGQTEGAVQAVEEGTNADTFNVANFGHALAAVVHHTTRDNLEALIRATGHDMDTLLELATSGEHPQAATNIIFAATLQRMSQFVEASWDETFTSQAETTEVQLAQSDYLRALHSRMAALEREVAAAASFGANRMAADAIAAIGPTSPLAIRIAELEATVSDMQEAVDMQAHNNDNGEEEADIATGINANMARTLARIQQLREMRRERESQVSERMDQQRGAEVGQLAQQIGALQARTEALEKREQLAAKAQREMRNFQIAYLLGDLTKEEYVERLRGIQFF